MEGRMLELICQQRYQEKKGIPVDISGYRNHGGASDTSPAPGPAPNRGAIQLSKPNSRVLIPPGTWGAWTPLVALKIEVDLKIEPTSALEQTLVEGSGSFLFSIDQHAPAASVVSAGGTPMYVRAAGAFAPDGGVHPVPTGRWVTLGFQHDGFARMQLLIDGQLVGESIVDESVPGVSAPGVSVGNRVAGGQPLLGNIEELRVWRLDPRQMKRDFLSRPYTSHTAACWEELLRQLARWLRENPVSAGRLTRLLETLQRQFLHGLLLLPQAEQAQARRIVNRYELLWRQGRIDGPEMAAVFVEFIRWMRRHGLDPESGPVWSELEPLLRQISEATHAHLNCDQAAQRFRDLMRHADREAR
jgi:hypothetical protein